MNVRTYPYISHGYIFTDIIDFFAGIVSETESLFTYPLRESWHTYYDPNFTPSFAPVFANPSLEAEAIEACDNDTFCLYDIATTGRMDIGLSTLDGSRSFDEIVQLSYPSKELFMSSTWLLIMIWTYLCFVFNEYAF